MQAQLDAVRAAVERHPMIPALKATIGAYLGDAHWEVVRPPLLALTADQKSHLLNQLHELDFRMPGLHD